MTRITRIFTDMGTRGVTASIARHPHIEDAAGRCSGYGVNGRGEHVQTEYPNIHKINICYILTHLVNDSSCVFIDINTEPHHFSKLIKSLQRLGSRYFMSSLRFYQNTD